MNKQLQAFKDTALHQYEDELVDHINTYFPAHFTIIGEKGVRDMIRYGYGKAKVYGCTTKRNVCLYVNNMILLGSNYDTDPQYPWAKDMLDEVELEPKERIDKLVDTALDFIHEITGAQHIYLNRALLNLHHNADAVFDALMNKSHKGYLYHLEKLNPKKYEVVGIDNIGAMIKMGKVNAYQYNLRSEPGILLYIVLMFIMGSGFDKDPQFAWVEEILKDTDMPEDEKLILLYQKLINNLRSFISKV